MAKIADKNAVGLIALVGLTAASLLYDVVPKDEGKRNVAYQDIVGIWTICYGDTYDVKPGQIASDGECQKRLEKQLVKHAIPVLKSTPRLGEPGRDYQRAGAVSIAYNIGTGGWAQSTADKMFDAGRWVEGCNAFLSWNRGTFPRPTIGRNCVKRKDGRYACVVRGLDLRRKRERQICLTNLLPGHTPENLEARMRGVR